MTSDLLSGNDATLRTLLLISLIFLSGAALTILFILFSRIIKNRRQKLEGIYLATLQASINKLLFLEGAIPEASYKFTLDDITKVIRSNRYATQILINQIVKLKKNLSGASAKVLQNTYRDLRLYKFSIRKLSAWSWDKRAQGIRELSEMNHIEALKLVPSLVKTRNRTLREELLLSTIRLDKQNPLGFLDRWDGEITAWMRIHIHHYLSQLDNRTLPNFSRWFESPKEDVVIFAITMTQQFQQSNSAPGLVRLLSHPNPAIVTSAIGALTELEAFSVVDNVAAVADTYWANDEVSIAVVRFLAKTGHSREHMRLLERYLGHRALTARLEAVRGLSSMGPEGFSMLAGRRGTEDNEIGRLIAHASEPLLG